MILAFSQGEIVHALAEALPNENQNIIIIIIIEIHNRFCVIALRNFCSYELLM